MANAQYDLDISGGLMPQIQALLAPPSLEDFSKERRKDLLSAQHPYYKRPGRGHNRDCCDACKEGGGLICCDSCPASFHLQCHDPPLEESSLPKGLWHCHSCRVRKAEESAASETILQTEETDEDDGDSDTIKNGKHVKSTISVAGRRKMKLINKGQPLAVGKRRRTNNSDECDPSETDDVVKDEKLGEKEEIEHTEKIDKSSVFGPLIKVAASMNPQQFELPPELVEPIVFPGSSKSNGKKQSSGPKKKSHELDNGLVPLPLRACFYCHKSCRKAPLVACDFCPLVFHLDCLDPPLVCMPVGKWMCPNHPQNYEYKLLPDTRLTERVKFWSFLQRPVDQEAVKINFLRKVSRKNPPFRMKVPLPTRLRMKVPQIIKDQYKHPPLLPLRLGQPPSCFWQSVLPETRKIVIASTVEDSSETEDCEGSDQVTEGSDQVTEGSDQVTEGIEQVIEPESDKQSVSLHPEPTESTTEILPSTVSDDSEEFSAIEEEVKKYLGTLRRNVKERKLKVFMEQLTNDLLSTMDEQTLRILAMQRVQHLILNPESRSLTMFPFPGLFTNNANSSVTIHQPWLHPSSSSDTAESNKSSNSNTFPRQPRAFLCPLSSAYPPTPVYYRRLTVGTGANMDLMLGSFGSCRFVSGHHATIFYDEMSKHFELLNYSEHGTVVDNVLYCCNNSIPSSMKRLDDSRDEADEVKESIIGSKEKPNSLFQGADDMLRRNFSPEKSSSNSEGLFNDQNQGPPCGCLTSNSSLSSTSPATGPNSSAPSSGWEGTALLTHGSHIKFGCQQFILCISNTNEKPRFIHH